MENCKFCNNNFIKASYQQAYCSVECRDEFHKQEQITWFAKNGPLAKAISCVQCQTSFIRSKSKQNTCSKECKIKQKEELRKISYIKEKKEKQEIKIINSCEICGISFHARTNRQKCCSEECRSFYSRKDMAKRARENRKEDVNVRIAENLRSRLSRAIKKGYKPVSAVSDLGCSIEDFKRHLESKFYNHKKTGKAMSWDNYGEWHIDHVDAISKFDLTNEEELKKACHYTNLQPLWAPDNLSKGNR